MHPKTKLLNALSIFVIVTTLLSSVHLPIASAQRSDGIQRDYNAESGKVTRITGEGNEPIELMSAMSSDMTSTERSDMLVEQFGTEFGLVEPSEELVVAEESQPESDRVVTKYQQVYEGVPVMAGELIVNASRRGALFSMNGEVAQGLNLNTEPALSVETAIDIAKMGMVKWYGGTKEDYQHADASLQIFDESLLRPSNRPAELVWKMDMSPTSAGQPIRELVLVSAKTGNVPLHFNQIDTAWTSTKAEPIVEAQDEVPPTETPTPEPTETPLPTELPILESTPMPTEMPLVIEPTPTFAEPMSAASEGDVSATANTLYVDVATGSDANTCTLALPCASIQQAVNVAVSGDTVMIADGTYYRPSLNAAPGVVLLNKALTLSGGWKNNFTEQTGVSIVDGEYGISGSNKNNVGFLVTAGPSTIDHFVVQNSTSNDSGGIYVYASSLTVKNSSIINNHAANNGAGIFTINNSILDVQNSTISGNASNSGAGIYITNGSLTINNSTIAFNSAGSSGGGIKISAGTATMRNSILANNSATGAAPDCSGIISSSDHNIIQNISGCTVTSGTGDQFSVDPQLNTTRVGIQQVHLLSSTSPAIDVGDPGTCLDTDQVDRSRPYGNACDLGAYEYRPQNGVAVISGSGQTAELGYPFVLPFEVLVFDHAGNPVSGVSVTFTAPISGSTGVFSDSGTNTTTAISNASGKAVSSTFSANYQKGNYSILASVSESTISAVFLLTNDGPLYVAPTGSDTNSCGTPLQACATIKHALSQSPTGKTIKVAVGTYTGSDTKAIVEITKNITLLGGWDSTFTARIGYSTINGQNARPGIDVNTTSTAMIERFIIENGSASGYDGAAVDTWGNLTINKSIIRNNAGITIYKRGFLEINNSSIYNNSGPGIYTDTGNLNVNNVTISNNSSVGIYANSRGTTQINNTTITENRSSGGGGIDVTSGNVHIINSILANNTTTGAYYPPLPGDRQDCRGSIFSGGNNIIKTNFCAISGGSNDKIGVDPALGDFVALKGYQPLKAGSPAIDTGNPATCYGTTDQRGMPRVGVCDRGAYEYSASGAPVEILLIDGDGQYAEKGKLFAKPLKVGVFDEWGNPVSGVDVRFVAPPDGPSAVFSASNTFTTAATTDLAGVASVSLVANSIRGDYVVSASTNGIAGSVEFDLKNIGWYVRQDGNDSGDCMSPETACATINSAIQKSGSGAIIFVETGAYPGVSITTTNIIKEFTLLGGWDDTFSTQSGLTKIDGQDADAGIYVSNASVVIDHFWITRGRPGIHVFRGFSSAIGGPPPVNVTINNTFIDGNGAYATVGGASGGGIYISGPADVRINNSTISNNTAGSGGGIYSFGGSVTLNNSTISRNRATGSGGGIFLNSGSPNNNSNVLVIQNSTIAYNQAATGGGVFQPSLLNRPITVRNSIIANNDAATGVDCSTKVLNSMHSIIEHADSTCVITEYGSTLRTDPLISTYMVGTPGYHVLLSNSPAIDSGHAGTCLSEDQRYAARPQGSGCDRGAYEYMASIGTPNSIGYVSGSNQRAAPGKPFEERLRAYVTDASGVPIPGISVQFAATIVGPGGFFADTASPISTAVTDAQGVATSSPFTANLAPGSYLVTASSVEVDGSVEFSLRNVALYVRPDGNDAESNICTDRSNPCQTMNHAIRKAVAGDMVYVSSGTYNSVSIGRDITLSGGWNYTFDAQNGLTVVDGMGQRSGLIVDALNVVVEQFEIKNGFSKLGGGITVENLGYPYPTLTLRRVSIHDNQSVSIGSNYGNGGGIYVDYQSRLIVENSTIANNSAQKYGGGIYADTAPYTTAERIKILNSTITGNSAVHGGGGIYNAGGTQIGIDLVNSILAKNQNLDCVGLIRNAKNSIIGNLGGCTLESSIAIQTNIDPGLAAFTNGFFPLAPTSPAIDSGELASCLSVDQHNVPRPQRNGCDIGAYEYPQSVGNPVAIVKLQGDNQIGSPGQLLQHTFGLYAVDSNGVMISNTSATFAAPTSGPSGTFISTHTTSITVHSPSGLIFAPAFQPNSQLGTYVVRSTIDGGVSTDFTVTNAVWYVNPGSSISNPTCDTPISPCATIDQALSKAAPGNTIKVGSGTLTGTGPVVTTIHKHVTVSGGWNAEFTVQEGQTVIDGQTLRRAVMVGSGVTVSMDHFDLVNGKVMNANGAGVLNSGALTFTNGAIYNNVAHGVNLDTRISSDGGGIYSNGTMLTLTNVTISNNEADTGGGLFVHSGNTTLNNVTITQNLATNIGVVAYGGGIENKNNSPIIIRNTIIAGNSAEIGQDCYNQITSGGNNLIGYDVDCDITPAAGDLIGHFNPLNAGLGDLSDNNSSTKTHALLAGSPAINAGDPATCAAADQRGVARPQGATCDIGAFEGTLAQTVTVNAKTYSAGGQMKWPGDLLCDASKSICTNGADTTADAAHKLAIDTYEFYLAKHGRLGIDNNNMPIISTVHYCASKGCPYFNANWTGAQMIYGDGYGFAKTDDIVAHELTHGVTQFESNLYYYYQSGAINESFSDLWGEYFDQINLYGNDNAKVKWLVGEDLTGHGAFRSMKNPPQFKHPDKMTSTLYHNKSAYSKDWDNGGVHTNSGINNKAVYLMVDGGTFNGKTVTALGWEKVGTIYYEAQTNLLTSGSDYSDLYFALQQACSNLLGQHGITSANCTEVKDALTAVQMNSQPITNYNPDAPLCPTGTTTGTQITLFEDSFENGASNWNMTSNWDISSFDAADGSHHLVGNDSYALTDNTLTMQVGVPIPAGTQLFLHFKHSYGFSHNPGEYYDGAVLEYSTNDGITWRDAKPLFSAGQNYMGTIFKYPSYASEYGSALQGRAGFVGDSHGYVSSRYNLTSLAGKTVKFRWRFATDWDYDYMGWHLDDISIYQCVGTPSVSTMQLPVNNAAVKNYVPLLDWSNAKSVDHYELQVATDNAFTSLVYNELNLPTSQFQIPTALASNTKYFWRVRGVNGLGAAGKWTAPFTFRAVPLAPDGLSPIDGFVTRELRPAFDWDVPPGSGAITSYTIQFSKNIEFTQIVHTGTSTGSEYVPTANLPKNTTLYWRVLAKGANGSSAYSAIRSVVMPVNPPPTPLLLSPADNAVVREYTNPTLTWKPVTFADASFQHYQVQVATDAAFSNRVLDNSDTTSRTTGQLVTSLTLTPDTRYYWRVRAVNIDDEVSNWSTVWRIRAAIPAPTLTAPSNAATGVLRKPLLDWEDVPGNNGYVLQVWKGTTLVKTVTLSPDVSQYQFLTNLLANTTYTWKVQTKGNVASSTWSQFTFKTAP